MKANEEGFLTCTGRTGKVGTQAFILSVPQTPVKVKTLNQSRSVMPKSGIWLGNMNPDPWDGISGFISPKLLNDFLGPYKLSEPDEMILLSY